jgi:ribosome-associated protein
MSDQKYNSPEDPYFEDAQADEFEEEDFVSKTELKRQAKELHKLGETLVNLTDAHVATIPMDEELADAVAIARKVNKKKDGYRRQLQFIGKVLRQRDTTAIEEALSKITHQHQASNAAFHALEKAREAVIAQGDPAIQKLIEAHPELDRQKLRQFHRQIKKEREKNAPPKAFRELFQYLKDVIHEE